MSWSGMALTEMEKLSGPGGAGKRCGEASGRGCARVEDYFSDCPRVSGMRMKVISVMTAPAST
ncbi:hypothetical protein MyNCGM152_19160 [Achromobacter xylosoxidans]